MHRGFSLVQVFPIFDAFGKAGLLAGEVDHVILGSDGFMLEELQDLSLRLYIFKHIAAPPVITLRSRWNLRLLP